MQQSKNTVFARAGLVYAKGRLISYFYDDTTTTGISTIRLDEENYIKFIDFYNEDDMFDFLMLMQCDLVVQEIEV